MRQKEHGKCSTINNYNSTIASISSGKEGRTSTTCDGHLDQPSDGTCCVKGILGTGGVMDKCVQMWTRNYGALGQTARVCFGVLCANRRGRSGEESEREEKKERSGEEDE
ncbi:hypothetical protein TNCV_2322851 [Trichonephila clavipes]|nr:hypothetical protein TNCV_2322851 [Trichonephila clavipes]